MPAVNTSANVASISLTPGVWHVFGSVALVVGATTVFGTDAYIAASISTTSATENVANAAYVSVSNVQNNSARTANTFDTLNLSANTTVYLTSRHNCTTVGGASYTAVGTAGTRFYAIRIA
jgi:hypothetical protein